MTYERKFVEFDAKTEEDGTITGYGARFDIKDLGGDIILPGAFTKSLKERMPKMLWQHDMRDPIGVWEEASEDDRGLAVKGRINLEVQRGREAHSLAKQGAVGGLSIGFIPINPDRKADQRQIREAKVFEVSLVTLPMQPEANIQEIKNFHGVIDALGKREAEKALCDAGFSKRKAKTAIAVLTSTNPERDAGVEEMKAASAAFRSAISALRG